MDLGIGSFAGRAPGGNLCIGKEGGDGMRTVAIVLVGAAGLPSIELREVFPGRSGLELLLRAWAAGRSCAERE